MINGTSMKKEYSRPKIELIVFRYTDVMAASGEEPTLEAGVGDAEGSFGSGFVMSILNTQNEAPADPVWSDEGGGDTE